jgi:hypothetical protein
MLPDEEVGYLAQTPVTGERLGLLGGGVIDIEVGEHVPLGKGVPGRRRQR